MEQSDLPQMMMRARQAQTQHEAEAIYQEALERAPDHMPAWRGLIDLKLQNEQVADVPPLCLQVAQRFPHLRVMLMTKHATALDRLGRTEEAITLLVYLHAETADHMPSTVLLGHLFLKTKRFPEAEQMFRKGLELQPDHLGAWRGQSDALLFQNRPKEVLTKCDDVLNDPELCQNEALQNAARMKRAVALDRLGRDEEALVQLTALHEQAPKDVTIMMPLADILQRTGRFAASGRLYGQVLDLQPAHPGAWRGRIDALMQKSQLTEALTVCQEAMSISPAVRQMAHPKMALVLERLGRLEAAQELVATLRQDRPNDPGLMNTVARLHHKSGDLVQAAQFYEASVNQDPAQLPAWLGRIGVLVQMGDLQAALAVCETALNQAPTHAAELCKRKGELLIFGARFAEAVQVLSELLQSVPETSPTRDRVLHLLAEAHVGNGQPDLADKICLDLLSSTAPDPQVLNTYIKVAEGRSDFRGALERLRAMTGLNGDDHGTRVVQMAEERPELILKLCELQFRVLDEADMETSLEALATQAAALNDASLQSAFQLSERQNLPAQSVQFLKALSKRDRLSLQCARFLLTYTHVAGDNRLTTHLADRLETRLSGDDQAAFQVHRTVLLGSSAEGLAVARRVLRAPRSSGDLCLIGQQLIDSGAVRLAVRYLRLGCRKWPLSLPVRTLFLNACAQAGQYTAAQKYLEDLAGLFPDLDLSFEHMSVARDGGFADVALALADKRKAAGLKSLIPAHCLDLVLAQGDLDKVRVFEQAMRDDPATNAYTAAHFGATLRGHLITDLQLHDDMMAHHQSAGMTPDAIRSSMIETFYFAAQSLVATHYEQQQPIDSTPPASDVPRHIVQYWNAAQPPEEITAMVAGWQGIDGFEHTLLDRSAAVAFLRANFGSQVVRAFLRARSPEEESDFIRLCFLFRKGGIYVDTDDRYIGGLETFVRYATGLMVSREPMGAIANNVIVASPQHPALKLAITMAMRALLVTDNDGAWFKTGPGMLTRAVAMYIDQTPEQEVARSLTLLAPESLRKHIQPHVRLSYKTTTKYWNAKERRRSQTVLEALGTAF